MTSISKVKPINYEKAFTFESLGYLLSYYFLANYSKIDFLIVYDNNIWRTFIPKSTAIKTLKLGRRIWANQPNFKKYSTSFKRMVRFEKLEIQYFSKLKTISKSDWLRLKKDLLIMYNSYEKTEFFFADSGYINTTPQIKKNMLIVGELKMQGRQVLNDLLINALHSLSIIFAKQFKLNVEDVKFYNLDEILSFYSSKKPVSTRIITQRKNSFVLVCHKKKIIALEGAKRNTILRRFKERKASGLKQFSGIVANRGFIRGKVRRIIPDYKGRYQAFKHEIASMKNGEILVTETTSPEFIPAMKKAKGIITNQGGLGSHAAIVSREMNIPCIVGTQNATEILKTGDLIELNANNGIVKIIK